MTWHHALDAVNYIIGGVNMTLWAESRGRAWQCLLAGIAGIVIAAYPPW